GPYPRAGAGSPGSSSGALWALYRDAPDPCSGVRRAVGDCVDLWGFASCITGRVRGVSIHRRGGLAACAALDVLERGPLLPAWAPLSPGSSSGALYRDAPNPCSGVGRAVGDCLDLWGFASRAPAAWRRVRHSTCLSTAHIPAVVQA